MLENVKKNFGFGCMRLPLNEDESVDYEQFNKMIDMFMENGFNYFDTAHGYLKGYSEMALKDCLVKRYPRNSYILVNKLSSPYVKEKDDVRKIFEEQLRCCGVSYFDVYLMHAQNKRTFEFYKEIKAYEQALELKDEGKIKCFGISFHDTPEVLDEILTTYPQIEVVQIQFNYMDMDNPAIQARKCHEVCVKHNKKIIIMEPVKGGHLVRLPLKAKEIFDKLNNGTSASYAIRFAASFKNVFMVLSGMSNIEQMLDNVSFMKDFKPLNKNEYAAIEKVKESFINLNTIACTNCRYCVEGCVKDILIPDLIYCMNAVKVYDDWGARYAYKNVHTKEHGKASNCIKCGKCELTCPQHLPIRNILEDIAKELEK